MLIYSTTMSVDGFITDRARSFGRTVPEDEEVLFRPARVGELGGSLCRRTFACLSMDREDRPPLSIPGSSPVGNNPVVASPP